MRTPARRPESPVTRGPARAARRDPPAARPLPGGRLLQAKLCLGPVDDPLEREADRVAEAVVSAPAAAPPVAVQRKCGACAAEEETAVRRSPGALPVRDEEEKLQTKRPAGSSSPAPEVGARTAASIGSLRGGGAPLTPAARGYFEPRFGRDLSAVRLHTGAEAASAAHEVGARAFTVGSDVAFGSGEYRPETGEGRKLLAHELAHTVQQGDATGTMGLVQRDVALPLPNAGAPEPQLTEEQIQAARRYNAARIDDPYVWAIIRDVIGVSRFPAVVDADLVRGLARWQAWNNLTPDGRLTTRTTDTLVAEVRAEGGLVPRLLGDATRVELEAGLTFNPRLRLDAQSIRILQREVGARQTGVWDDASVSGVLRWQRTRRLEADGRVGPATLRSLIEALVAANALDDAIHVIVDAYHFPIANLAAITFDATVTGADAVTAGTIGAGQPQTVRVGPSTFTEPYAHMIRIIGHELQHVQQRSAATPIVNQDLREFLAFAWEALDEGAPRLAAAARVNHANIAIRHWNRVPAADQVPHQAVRDRLDRLIAAGGVGAF